MTPRDVTLIKTGAAIAALFALPVSSEQYVVLTFILMTYILLVALFA